MIFKSALVDLVRGFVGRF